MPLQRELQERRRANEGDAYVRCPSEAACVQKESRCTGRGMNQRQGETMEECYLFWTLQGWLYLQPCGRSITLFHNCSSHELFPTDYTENNAQAASIARTQATSSNGSGDYLSGLSSGFSGDSNDAGSPEDNSNDAGSPDLEDNNSGGGGKGLSSEDRRVGEAVSSDYGGGTSSGSFSGDGNSASRNKNSGSNHCSRGGKAPRKKARRVCPPLPAPGLAVVRPPPRGGGGGRGGRLGACDTSYRAAATNERHHHHQHHNQLQQKQQAATATVVRKVAGPRATGTEAVADGRGGPGGRGIVEGPERETRTGTVDNESPTSALAALAAAAAAAEAAPLSTTATRLALSAKKSILFRHGADSQIRRP